MAQIPRPTAHRVDIIEYERGWGSRVDEAVYFDNREEAIKYCDDFNSKNTAKEVPDWYMIAEYQGPV